MPLLRRLLVFALALDLAGAGVVAAQPPLIGAAEVAAAAAYDTDRVAAARSAVMAALDRDDVAAALAARGVSMEAARERAQALTDAEALQLAATIDTAPAGGTDLLGAVLFVFVLLLITDILGLTKVFPFTRSVR